MQGLAELRCMYACAGYGHMTLAAADILNPCSMHLVVLISVFYAVVVTELGHICVALAWLGWA